MTLAPTTAATRIPSPTDPALPGLQVLLAAEEMAPLLQRSLDADTPVGGVRVYHVRYLPGTKASVCYDVCVGDEWHAVVATIAARDYLARRAAKPASAALAALVDGRSPAARPMRYEPELGALIQWYPLDLALPALAEPVERLLDELEQSGVTLGDVHDEPQTLAYTPRRRAVLRVGPHVLKFYADSTAYEGSVAGLRAVADLRNVPTAALEGHLPSRHVTVQPLLHGVEPPRPAEVAGEVGALLRELQAASPSATSPQARPPDQLAVAAASARYIAMLLPALGGRLETLLRELEAAAPPIDRLVASHGDFYVGQLLATPAGLAVIDWDAIRCAPAALDPASYAAHLVSGEPDDLDEAAAALEDLLVGYGSRPTGLPWYLATCILRHARSPFRYFDEDWPGRIESMVAAAETALAG
jgi:Phosphotransferase enzyme family